MNLDYSRFEEESHIDSDAPIAGPSTRSQDWYLNPAPEGYGEQSGYEGSTSSKRQETPTPCTWTPSGMAKPVSCSVVGGNRLSQY